MKLFKYLKQWNEERKQIEASKTKDEKIKQLNLFIMLFSSGIVALVLLAVLLLLNAQPFYLYFLPLSVLVPFGGYSVMKINRLDLAALKRYKASQK